MPPQNNPDRIRILFDDHRLVANAGLLLPATLARHLGLRDSSTITLTSAARRDGRTLGTRCSWSLPRYLHRRRRCAGLVGRSVF